MKSPYQLPVLTTMMLDALAKTLPDMPQNNRAAAVCRCVFQVYTMAHGATEPWKVTGETVRACEKRVQAKPVTIIDTTAEVTDESTRIYEKNRSSRARPVAVSSVSRQWAVSGAHGKRMSPPNNGRKG